MSKFVIKSGHSDTRVFNDQFLQYCDASKRSKYSSKAEAIYVITSIYPEGWRSWFYIQEVDDE